ncbi:uncharacterized protein LOC116996264 isoform X3 [Catharus ustulatus]|uniref:uncharacterized protein LOC116996264 isoform X3 n=1 Tax=Catharus ustulatus TaxID=91951 RepID=UPI00140DA533|nr:uncharacterized protein LOC116996264 isoform X3 [Catharus ustulatus]
MMRTALRNTEFGRLSQQDRRLRRARGSGCCSHVLFFHGCESFLTSNPRFFGEQKDPKPVGFSPLSSFGTCEEGDGGWERFLDSANMRWI